MPGYGTLEAEQGTGLLPWSWALERLARSHDYWIATKWPDGRPHVRPVWGVWHKEAFWFSSGRRSRKARNLAADPRCAVTNDQAREPVIIEGSAQLVTDPDAISAFAHAVNKKYETDYPVEFYDPDINATFSVTPASAFGLSESDYTGSPTWWEFES